MYDNILEDAQKVKKHLSALGENADETAICELLKSFGPVYELDHIISIITENWDAGFQNNSNEVISITDETKMQRNTEKVAKPSESMQRSSMDDTYAETSDASSDYEDDRYYYSPYWDDVSVVDTVTRPLSSPSDIYGNTSSPNRSEAISIPAEVEFLEENNNDPNNNLDSVQMLYELQNNSSDINDEKRDVSQEVGTELVEKPESPKPGCSKDSHDAFTSQEDSKLHTEAGQISALLPRFKYSTIYKILCHNSNAKNRIELTLWNLLSENKPKAEFSTKRKHSDDVSSEEQSISEISKSNGEAAQHIHSKKPQPTLKRAVTLDECRRVKRHSTEAIISDNMDSGIDQQGAVSITEAKSKRLDNSDNESDACNVNATLNVAENTAVLETTVLETDPNNKESKLTIDSVQKITAQRNILRPPKLMFVSNITKISEPSTPVPKSCPILLPPKLKCFTKIRKRVNTKSSETESNIDLKSKNFGTVEDVKQNINDEHPSLNTLTDGTNKQTSDVKIVDSHSSVNSVRDKTSQNKSLSKIKITEISLSKNTVLNCVESINTKDINILTEVSSGESKVKSNLKQEKDINVTQAMPLTKANATNAAAQSGSSRSFQSFDIQYPAVSYNQPVISYADSKPKIENNCTSMNDKASMSIDLTMDNIEQGNPSISNITNPNSSLNLPTTLFNEDILCTEAAGKAQVEQKDVKNNATDKTTILSQRALKIYYKLIPMFPCIDTNYIKKLCQAYIKDDMVLMNETVLLQDLVEQLLDHGQEHPCLKKIEPVSAPSISNVNEQYANLLGIFPKADPVYLRNIAEQMYNDPDKMKEFVQSKLEKPDYPTKEQYLARKKITEQQKQYTTDFQVQQFLEIFPDPFTHFENQKRKCEFSTAAVDFLKHYFNKIRVNTLLSVYYQYKHNLSLTAKHLETLNSNMKSKRFYPLVQMENIPLLQECAFIQHKAEITNYLAKLKEEEEKEFNELKAKNALLECQCCFDNECMSSKCSTCEEGHIFCNLCIVKSTDVKLADGETHIRCFVNCDSEFPLAVLQRVLPPTKFSILLQKRQEAEVMAAGLEGLVSCPFCHFASIPPQEDKIFKCFNPDCMKESCRLCKEINHLPLKCNEVKSDAARLYLEEKMTEALIRKCYRCGRTFFKEEGCNKMTCICGAQMCYICDEPITNYRHFRGQGDTASNLCPLWSDDRRMNAESVIQVCKETIKHIKEKNPEVKINTDALMPKLPPKRSGPHEDVAHANALPAHINRVMRHIP